MHFLQPLKTLKVKYVSASAVTENLDLSAERIKILNKATFQALKI